MAAAMIVRLRAVFRKERRVRPRPTDLGSSSPSSSSPSPPPPYPSSPAWSVPKHPLHVDPAHDISAPPTPPPPTKRALRWADQEARTGTLQIQRDEAQAAAEQDHEFYDSDDDRMSQGRLRVGNRGGVATGLENWDDDFLDQTSAPSSPERTRTAAPTSVIRHPLRARSSMDSDAWDMSSDDEAVRRAPPFPSLSSGQPISSSPPTGLLPSPVITSSSRPAAAPSRGPIARRTTAESSRWETESNDDAFYTPRETMYFESPPVSLSSHYEPTERVSSVSHYDPTEISHYDPTEPRSRQSVAALAMADDEHDDDDEDEVDADRTVTLSRPPPPPPPVMVDTDSESEYERDRMRRGPRTPARTPRTASTPTTPAGPSQPKPVVTALPPSTSPVPPSPSPTHSRSHSHSQSAPYGRPSIGGASSIFSPSIKSTAPLRDPSAPPTTSKYPGRPGEHTGERPPRRLKKKRRRPGPEEGMVELVAMVQHEEHPPPVPVLPTTPELPVAEPPPPPANPPSPSPSPSHLPALPPKSPRRPSLPLPLPDPAPPLPAAPQNPTPNPNPYVSAPPPPSAGPGSGRHIFHGSISNSANPAAILTRLSSFRRFLPRSTSANNNNSSSASARQAQSPPTIVGARGQGRAQSESPTAAIPESGPAIPRLPVGSAPAAAGQRKSKSSAPAAMEVGDDPEGMFGPGPPGGEEVPPVPALPGVEEGMGLGRRVGQGVGMEVGMRLGREGEGRVEGLPEQGLGEGQGGEQAREEAKKPVERKEKSGREWTRIMDRARSATVSGVVTPPVPPPPPPPVHPPPATKSEHREHRKPRKLSHRRPHHKEDGIKGARDSLDLNAPPPLPSVASERALEELAAAEAAAEPSKEARRSMPMRMAGSGSGSTTELVPPVMPGSSPLSSRAASPLNTNMNLSRPITPSASRAITPISPTPLTPISPTSKALPHVPTMDRTLSQGSELRIPQRISLQQRSLKEGLTDVRQFAGIVEDLRDLQAQHATLLAFLAASASPRSNKLPRAVRRGSQASQMQVEAGLARSEASNHVWWELAGVLVDLGGSRPNGSVRAAKDRLNVRDAMQEPAAAEPEPESAGEGRTRPIDIPQSGQRSRYRAASMAATKHTGFSTSPSSPALPSSMEPGLQAPRSASLGVEKMSQREETPKELTSRQLVLLAEMLHEADTARVVEYGEHVVMESATRSRAPSRAGLHTPLPASSPSSRPPTRSSNLQLSPANTDTIGRPRRGSKIMSNIKDIFTGKKSNRESVEAITSGYVTSDAEGPPPTNGTPRSRHRSSSRPPTTQPPGDSSRFRSGGSARKSPRKPSLGSIFGSRQAHEKKDAGERTLPPTIVGRAPRGNGSSTTVDTDLEDESDWDRAEPGVEGVPTVRGRPGLNGNNPARARPALPIASAHTSPGKTLSIQTSYTRDIPSRMSERPPLESAKLALTPENIRPLLGHAKEVRRHLEECVADLRALQPRGDIKL